MSTLTFISIHAWSDLLNSAIELTCPIKHSLFEKTKNKNWSNVALSYLFPTSLHLVSSINQYNPFVLNKFKYLFCILKCYLIEFIGDKTKPFTQSTLGYLKSRTIIIFFKFIWYKMY